MEADLKSKLAAHGVELPERPQFIHVSWEPSLWFDMDERDVEVAETERSYALALESALSRVVGMLEAAQRRDRTVGCAHRFSANHGMYDSVHRYCEICGLLEDAAVGARANCAGKRGEGAL